MEQRLIVEGNDAIALANILKRRGIKPPKGYRNEEKFKSQFVKSANGYDNVTKILEEELESPNVSRIGIIVDANEAGPKARFNSLKNYIEKVLKIKLPPTKLTEAGIHLEIFDNLTLGIWIMPDNQTNGYLEHFMTNLISEDSPVLSFAEEKVAELVQKSFCPFSGTKKQKALLHTYLA